MAKFKCPYDLLLNGKVRLEVKSCGIQARKGWKFNLHRHGKLQPEVDFYVLVIPPIEAINFKKFTILVVPSSEVNGTLVLCISPRDLMLKWGKFFNRWDLIREKLLDTTLTLG